MKTNLHVKTREMKANLTMRRRAGILCGLGTTFLLLLIGQSCSAATVTWDGGGDGRSWNDAVNWSNDRVPGVTDNVVLPASTATNVFYRGTQPSPRSLRNNGTLRIAGNGAVGNAALTVSGSLTNFGTIILESSDSSYNETLTVGGILRNNANGVIQVNQGSGGGRYLYANVANEGTLNVTNGTELYCYGAGRTFDQQAGTVNGAGKFVWSDGWFSYAGGSVTGAVYVRDGVLEVAEAAANSSIYCSGNTTLIANWAEGVTVWVQGNSWYGNAILTTSEGAINAGTIRLESAHSSYQSALSIGGFDFLNAPTGVIDVNTGTGGPRSISGHFINQGLVDATDYYVDIFGVYESAGGRTLGNARLQSASVSVTASPDQPTTLDLWGNTTLLTDNLPNTVLWVHGNSGGGSHATLTATLA